MFATGSHFASAPIGDARAIAAGAQVPAVTLDVVGPGAPQRARVESYIAGVYATHYGAHIPRWAPTLVSLSTGRRIIAAAGYRAASEPLFLECYLARPIETVIAARTGALVARHEIVEVGHFAAERPGTGRRLLPMLARHLVEHGYRWVVSTATRELRLLFVHLGVRPLALARANPGLLGTDAACWGRYYDHEPVVVAGDLLRSLPLIERGRRQ
jgi:hypothetical protein